MIFFHREARFAQVGDVLFQGSIGRTDFPRGNHAELIEAITGKLWPLGDDVAFVPGHGPMSTFGQERQTNPFVADESWPMCAVSVISAAKSAAVTRRGQRSRAMEPDHST